MTRILRLLLIAAIALPYCGNAAAQEVKRLENFPKIDKIEKGKVIQDDNDLATEKSTKVVDKKAEYLKKSRHKKAMSIKSAGKQIYDYYSELAYDGNSYSENVPIRCAAMNLSRSEGQMIYNKTGLSFLQPGDIITSISFFKTDTTAYVGNKTNKITLRIGETQETQIPNDRDVVLSNRASLTEVYTGPLTFLRGYIFVTLEFDKPYTYQGGNLMLDLERIDGDYATTVYWYYGSGSSNCSYYSYARTNNSPNSGRNSYMPSIIIDYKRKHVGSAQNRDITVESKEFFEGTSYSWPFNETPQNQQSSNLGEPATDPDQIIAMVRKIYTDPDIPGNKKRGFAADGSNNTANQEVYYQGVGGIERTGRYYYDSGYRYLDSHGWDIEGNLSSLANEYVYGLGTFYYKYLKTDDYTPEKEGLTLLLVELKEDYVPGSNKAILNSTAYTTEYQRLKAMIQNTIKSVRVVSEAKRTGEGLESGTLFKINCDKMNKFFFLAKGQLHLDRASYFLTNDDFCVPPFYYYLPGSLFSSDRENYAEMGVEFFYNMFEQFSPVVPSATQGRLDIYQDLVNMESFGVKHDCLGITYMNHQFLMYGADSKDEDCQDVRDMMFFVPDYRMLNHSSRDVDGEDYLNYHPDLQPTIGLYVIRQDEITPTAQEDDYYMLQLNWRTNLDDFLPSQDQEFELLQLVIDENGQEKYIPVYYMDAQGNYLDADGNPSDTPVAIVLQFGPDEDKKYPNVYVERLSHGQMVTYAIRGRDTGKFLSLQTSNRQSYLVPGTDPTELVMLNNATYYSRYNPQTEKNCYSNKILVGNFVGGLTDNLIQGGTTNPTIFKFYRMLSENDANPVLIATAKVSKSTSGNGGTLQITMEEGSQSQSSEFPFGSATGLEKPAGYHANKTQASFTYYKDMNGNYITDNGTNNGNKFVNFGSDFYIYDNFVEDLNKENLPNRFFYKIEFNTAQSIQDENGNNVRTAHGNLFNIPVYRTATDINGAFTFDQVKNDENGNLELPDAINFDMNFEYGSKTELYRYAAYRWMNTAPSGRFILKNVDGDDEDDLPPTGTASFQGDYLTVSMNNVNESQYYETHNVTVAQSGYTKGSFIDNVPIIKADNPAAVYDYAPVIERLASGFDANRTDYNTYGGIIQSVATGKLNLEDATDAQFMSIYNWENEDKTKKYAYYTIKMSLDKSIPETQGYSLYKIRAWRVLDPSIEQAEELPEMQGRMGAKVMFEDVTYDPSKPYIVDELDVVGAAKNSPEGSQIPYYTGTFGAQKLRTTEREGDNSVIDEIKGKIIVRMYFTRNANLPTSNAPRLLDETTADGKFYIVEKEIEFSKTGGGTITGIDNLEAREVAGVKYYNVAGIESDQPFKGVNIVVTRYTDGSVVTKKVIR